MGAKGGQLCDGIFAAARGLFPAPLCPSRADNYPMLKQNTSLTRS